MTARNQMTAVMDAVFERLVNTRHDALEGLRERYYYRGSFILLEHLSSKALAWNITRLRRRGEHEHAEKLEAWRRVREESAP